jgi:hypothetical protein
VEEIIIVLLDPLVEPMVMTEIAITEDLLPLEMATIVHLEAIIHAIRKENGLSCGGGAGIYRASASRGTGPSNERSSNK